MAAQAPDVDDEVVARFVAEHPDGGRYEEIAAALGVSHQRVQALLGNAMRKIRKHLQKAGTVYADVAVERGESISARLESHGEKHI